LEDIKSINVGNWKKVVQNIVGRKWLRKPEPYIGCSALQDEEEEEEEEEEEKKRKKKKNFWPVCSTVMPSLCVIYVPLLHQHFKHWLVRMTFIF
jgi:hypothetical protein